MTEDEKAQKFCDLLKAQNEALVDLLERAQDNFYNDYDERIHDFESIQCEPRLIALEDKMNLVLMHLEKDKLKNARPCICKGQTLDCHECDGRGIVWR